MAHECAHDGLPCFGLSACYGHLKAAALNGGYNKLTDEERAFVGVEVNEHARPRDGWRSPIALVIDRLGGGCPPRTCACSSAWRAWTRLPKNGSSSSAKASSPLRGSGLGENCPSESGVHGREHRHHAR